MVAFSLSFTLFFFLFSFSFSFSFYYFIFISFESNIHSSHYLFFHFFILFFFLKFLFYFSKKKGGGRRFAYPEWVFSTSGGWWPHPKKWKRNTAIALVGLFGVVGLIFNYSANNEVIFFPFFFFLSSLNID